MKKKYPIPKPHSCKLCTKCISKKNKSTGNKYYICTIDYIVIVDSIFDTNKCNLFNHKSKTK